MEPRQHEALPSSGQESVSIANGELTPQDYELSAEHAMEKIPAVGEVQAEVSQIAMPALPLPVLSAPAAGSQVQTDDSGPLVAGDDDLIEKEWVEKAKAIIAATKDDPYKREREISRLQIEYIRKRYGRTIGDTGE